MCLQNISSHCCRWIVLGWRQTLPKVEAQLHLTIKLVVELGLWPPATNLFLVCVKAHFKLDVENYTSYNFFPSVLGNSFSQLYASIGHYRELNGLFFFFPSFLLESPKTSLKAPTSRERTYLHPLKIEKISIPSVIF